MARNQSWLIWAMRRWRNRNGLISAATATTADGHAERDAALLMLDQRQKNRSGRITVGADKA